MGALSLPGTPISGVGASSASVVLVVEDAEDARALVRRALEADGMRVVEAATGAAGIEAVAAGGVDVVLLDLAMPDMDGIEVLTRLRQASDIPVIVVSGRAGEGERVLALDLGADDFVTKPFLSRELPARIRSVLRRGAAGPTVRLEYGPLAILVEEREVILDGRVVMTTPKEFDLLVHLASAPRRVHTRDELLKEVWRSDTDWQDPATVTEHVRRLRRKIEVDPENPRWIQTVRGVGYRFEPNVR